jgi:predicted phosphodiesterase
MKRIICSDFHVGNEVSDYDRVMGFLEFADDVGDELLILGDWLELLWSNMTILTTVAPYKYITQRVKDIATRKPVSCVIGNHDWNIGLFASLIEPVKIVQPFAENGVFYVHGHEYDWESFILGTPIDPIWWSVNIAFFTFPLGLGFFLLNKILGTEEDAYNKGIAIIHERASNYALKNGYHSVVFGHTHLPIIETRNGINLYNSGDQVDSYSYLIQENGIINLRTFS